jgi:hypothetical protein
MVPSRVVRSIVAFLALLWLSAPDPAPAQTITGTVHDRDSGAPVATAMVALLDDAGERLLWVVTDREGQFRLRAPAPGTYRLRADRIGLRSETLDGVRVGEGEVVSIRFEVGSRAIELPPVEVEAARLCEIPDREGLLISDLWEEARKALELSTVTQRERALHVRGQERERVLDLVTLGVLDERLRSWAGVSRSPYLAAPAEELARDGYAREARGGHEYFGVAPETILSRSFEETHCFRVRPPGRGQPSNEIGLAFEPAPGRTVPDVTGVLWLDRETARLLRVEYAFTRHLHPVPLPEEPFGGRTDFGWLEDGTVIVEGWWLRMPQFERIVSSDRLPPGTVVRGGVWTEHQATTDADGRFVLSGLPAGEVVVSWQHPTLDALALVPEPLTRAGRDQDTIRVALGTPSPATVYGSRCEPNRAWIWGLVRARPDDRPVHGAFVVADWSPYETRYRRTTGTDRLGGWVICDVDHRASIRVSAQWEGAVARGVVLPGAGQGSHVHLTLDPP